MVDKGWYIMFKGGILTAARRLQTHPPQPVARPVPLEREGLSPVKGLDRVAAMNEDGRRMLREHLFRFFARPQFACSA